MTSERRSSRSSRYCNHVFFDPLWLLGVAVAALSIYINGLALEFGNAVLITSTVGFTIVCNDVLAWVVFGERFDCGTDGISALIVSLGSFICAFQQPASSTYPTDPEELLKFESKTLHNEKLIGFIALLTFAHYHMEVRKRQKVGEMRTWWHEFVVHVRTQREDLEELPFTDSQYQAYLNMLLTKSFTNNKLISTNDSFVQNIESNRRNFSFSAYTEPLLDVEAIHLDKLQPVLFNVNQQQNISNLIDDKQTFQIVLDNLQELPGREPNQRELNDILFEMKLDNFRQYIMKVTVVNSIDDELYLHEQSEGRANAEQIENELIDQQMDLQGSMNWLLGIESFISGLYSGMSTVALKIIVGFVNVLNSHQEVD